MVKEDFLGRLLVGYPDGCWEAVEPKYGKVDKVD
jgi:hypothetical protein